MIWLREHLPDDAIITNGAGNYAGWVHRFYRFRRFAHPACADVGLDGLWRAGRGRRQAPPSRTHRGRLCRRRLLS